MLLNSKHSKNSKQTKHSQNTFKFLTYVWSPKDKNVLCSLNDSSKIGRPGIAASLKLLRAILNLGSHLLSLFSQSGKGLEFTVLGALVWEGKEE